MVGLSEVHFDGALGSAARGALAESVGPADHQRAEGGTSRDGGSNADEFLSRLPAGRVERRLALAVVSISVLVFAVAAPFAQVPLARIDAFIPTYQSATAINEIITAILLLGQ